MRRFVRWYWRWLLDEAGYLAIFGAGAFGGAIYCTSVLGGIGRGVAMTVAAMIVWPPLDWLFFRKRCRS